MSDSLQDLVRRLHTEDGDPQALALAGLVEHGPPAVTPLQEALQSPRPRVRALAAEGLASIAEPAAAEALKAALNDPDERVRAHAAVGLANMEDPAGLPALVAHINDFPDVLHIEHSLPSYRLAAYGSRALPALAPLLVDPDRWTRVRAFKAIQAILYRRLGSAEAWQRLWADLGSYEPREDVAGQRYAAGMWAGWIARDQNATDL